MKTGIHLLRCGLLLLVYTVFFSYHSRAQNALSIQTDKNLTTLTFQTSEGTAKIYLPPDLKSGDIISGTIMLTPEGKKTRKIDQNKQALGAYIIELAGNQAKLANQILKWVIPKNINTRNLALLMKDSRGRLIDQQEIKVSSEPSSPTQAYQVPIYAVAGDPLPISGKFDGDFNTTQVRINGREAAILAESPDVLIADVPYDSKGPCEIEVRESGNEQSLKSNIVRLDLTAGKLSLRKGESTSIHAIVSGLEEVETPVPFQITNLSPGTISMQGGNTQEIVINPGLDASNGIYQKSFIVRAIVAGNFTVSANIAQPPEEESTEDDSELCDCRIQENSYLLSKNACYNLGGEVYNSDVDPTDLTSIEEPILVDQQIGGIRSSVSIDDLVRVEMQTIGTSEEIVSAIVSYRAELDTNWQDLEMQQTDQNKWYAEWNVSDAAASYVVRTIAVDKNQDLIETRNVVFNESFSISNADIRRARDRAQRARDRIEQEREALDRLRERQAEKEEEMEENERLAQELENIDKVLDSIPGTYRRNLKDLVDSLNSLGGQLPEKVDTAALNKAVDDARARLKACQDRLDNLKKEKEQLEKETADLKSKLDDVLNELDRIHLDNGWVGGHGYHKDGRPWYGYVGGERANINLGDKKYELQKQYRALKKSYVKAFNRLKNLPAEIEEAQEECDKLAEDLQTAIEAAQKGEKHVGTELAVEDICRQIRSLLKPLLKWCRNHPGKCDFENQLRAILDDCPKDSDALDDFWDDYDEIIDQKKEAEAAFESDAEDADAAANDLEDKIDEAEDRIRDLEAEERKAHAEAEALRRGKLKEEADAKRAQAEREARERERKKVKPQPILDEPLDASNDQLKYQSLGLFRGLYYDLFVSKGPCACETKAVAFANNTNTILEEIIARMAIGVAFAPLEAFPGLSLGARLGIGVLKAIASNLYGGQKLSEELLKNLFGVVGGEMFPKLVGNKFAGNRLNDLAGKGLEEILEEEGIRTTQWEGTAKLRNCGEVTGKTTMMFNPNTGWVVFMIKIPGCPLIVVKYKVNDDGVPISKPIVNKVS